MRTMIRYELALPSSFTDRDAVRMIESLRNRALTAGSYVTPLWRLSGTELLLDSWKYWPRTPTRHLTVRLFDPERDASLPVVIVGFMIRSNWRSERAVIALFQPKASDGGLQEDWIWEYESESQSLFGQGPLMQVLKTAGETGIKVTVTVHFDVTLVNAVTRLGHDVPLVPINESSMLTWMPATSFEALGIKRDRRRKLERPDGTIIERWSAPAIIRVDGRETIDDVIVCEQGDAPVLGSRALSGANLRLDWDTGTLADRGPIPAAAA